MFSKIPYDEYELNLLASCKLCPRKCKVNRLAGEKGFCNTDALINVSLVCNHKGEEPVLCKEKGICNVFFSHCNLQCIYCQNKQISDNKKEVKSAYNDFDILIKDIKNTLKESENVLGFVSPTHNIPLMRAIIRTLNKDGFFPKIVYNTNAYDNPEILKDLENIIDIYLPDYKYSDNLLAKELSKAENYPEIALKAIEEMYRQKGNSLLFDKENNIESGLILRHLVIPKQLENSKKVLENITTISYNISISLMSQYAPCESFKQEYLNQCLNQEDYEEICEYFHEIGLSKGWFQELSSQGNLVPNFENKTWSKR
ncbi:MAG: 4Fe-4S cluster-binding domain-containing protein [Bacteroidales bacterium]|jgi:putative pyruvate formate lyase activating enzyme|nr:4Fe-4S cluster-binding domain-containing protein [Bacteroidales bacterium]